MSNEKNKTYHHELLQAQLNMIQAIPGVVVKDLRELVDQYLTVKDGYLCFDIKIPAETYLATEMVDCFVQGSWGRAVPIFVAVHDLEESDDLTRLVTPYAMRWWDSTVGLVLKKENNGYVVEYNGEILVEQVPSIELAIVQSFKKVQNAPQ